MTELVFESNRKSQTPIQYKSRILFYLKHGDNYACAPMRYVDRETGEKSIESYYLTDGVYCWSSDIIHHFEKYNYLLPEQFILHVQQKMKLN